MAEALQGSRDRLASLGATRKDAIPAAKRHTARVARLRRGIVFGVAGLVLTAAVGAGLKSLSLLPIDLRFSHIGLKGSRITIETPKLIGYRQDGRPYQLTAHVGVQDMTTPDVFELEGVDARIEGASDDAVLLTAGGALYNAKTDHADLSGGVRIFNDKSFDLAMKQAVMDFKASVLRTSEPATLKLDKLTIDADEAEFVQPERRASFSGHVHTVLEGEAAAGKDD